MQGDEGVFRLSLADSLVYFFLGSGASSEVVPTLKPCNHLPGIQAINNSCSSHQNGDASQNTEKKKVGSFSSLSFPSSPSRSEPCNKNSTCSNSSSTSTSAVTTKGYKRRKEAQHEEVERKKCIREAKMATFWCQLEAHRQQTIKSSLFSHFLKNASTGCSMKTNGVDTRRSTSPTKQEHTMLCVNSPPPSLLERGEVSKPSPSSSPTVCTTALPSFLALPESSSFHSSAFSSPMVVIPLLKADNPHPDHPSTDALPSFPSRVSESLRSFLLAQYTQYKSSLSSIAEDSLRKPCLPPTFLSIIWPQLYMTCDTAAQTVELQCDQMGRPIAEAKEKVMEGSPLPFLRGDPSSPANGCVPHTVKKTYRLAQMEGVHPLTLASCLGGNTTPTVDSLSQPLTSSVPLQDVLEKSTTHSMESSWCSSSHDARKAIGCPTVSSSSSSSSAGMAAAPSYCLPFSSSFSSFIQPDYVRVRWDHRNIRHVAHSNTEPMDPMPSDEGEAITWNPSRNGDGVKEEDTSVECLPPSTASSSSFSALPNTVHITLIAVENLPSRASARQAGLRWYAALCAAALEGRVDTKETEKEAETLFLDGADATTPGHASASASCSYVEALETYSCAPTREPSTMASLQGVMAVPRYSSALPSLAKEKEGKKGEEGRTVVDGVLHPMNAGNRLAASDTICPSLFFCVDAELREYDANPDGATREEKRGETEKKAPPAGALPFPHVYRTVPVHVGVSHLAALDARERIPTHRTDTSCTLSSPMPTGSSSLVSSDGGWWWWWSTFAILEWIQQILVPLLLFTFQIFAPLRSSSASLLPSRHSSEGKASEEASRPPPIAHDPSPLIAHTENKKEGRVAPRRRHAAPCASFPSGCSKLQWWLASLHPWVSFFHLREHALSVTPMGRKEGPPPCGSHENASTPEGLETAWLRISSSLTPTPVPSCMIDPSPMRGRGALPVGGTPPSLPTSTPVLPPASRPFFSVIVFPSAIRSVWRHQHSTDDVTRNEKRMTEEEEEEAIRRSPSTASLPSLLLCYPNPKGTMLFQYDEEAISTLCRGVHFLQANLIVYDEDQRGALCHTVEQWWRKKEKEKEEMENVFGSTTKGEESGDEKMSCSEKDGKPYASGVPWMWRLTNGWSTILESLRCHTFVLEKALQEMHDMHHSNGGIGQEHSGEGGGGSGSGSSRLLYASPVVYPGWRPHLAATPCVPSRVSPTPKVALPVSHKGVEGGGATAVPLTVASTCGRVSTSPLSPCYSCSGANPKGEEEPSTKRGGWDAVQKQDACDDHRDGCGTDVQKRTVMVEVVAFSPSDVLLQQRLDCSRKFVPMIPTDWVSSSSSSSPTLNADPNPFPFSTTVQGSSTTSSETTLPSFPLHGKDDPLASKVDRTESEDTTHRGISDCCSPAPMRAFAGGNSLPMPCSTSSSLLKIAETTVSPPITFLSFLLESVLDNSVDYLEKIAVSLHNASLKAMLRYQQMHSATAA